MTGKGGDITPGLGRRGREREGGRKTVREVEWQDWKGSIRATINMTWKR